VRARDGPGRLLLLVGWNSACLHLSRHLRQPSIDGHLVWSRESWADLVAARSGSTSFCRFLSVSDRDRAAPRRRAFFFVCRWYSPRSPAEKSTDGTSWVAGGLPRTSTSTSVAAVAVNGVAASVDAGADDVTVFGRFFSSFCGPTRMSCLMPVEWLAAVFSFSRV
jgi:hypothetical protein